jgi:hypothetical protein
MMPNEAKLRVDDGVRGWTILSAGDACFPANGAPSCLDYCIVSARTKELVRSIEVLATSLATHHVVRLQLGHAPKLQYAKWWTRPKRLPSKAIHGPRLRVDWERLRVALDTFRQRNHHGPSQLFAGQLTEEQACRLDQMWREWASLAAEPPSTRSCPLPSRMRHRHERPQWHITVPCKLDGVFDARGKPLPLTGGAAFLEDGHFDTWPDLAPIPSGRTAGSTTSPPTTGTERQLPSSNCDSGSRGYVTTCARKRPQISCRRSTTRIRGTAHPSAHSRALPQDRDPEPCDLGAVEDHGTLAFSPDAVLRQQADIWGTWWGATGTPHEAPGIRDELRRRAAGIALRQYDVKDIRHAAASLPLPTSSTDGARPRQFLYLSGADLRVPGLFFQLFDLFDWAGDEQGLLVRLIPKKDGGLRPIALFRTTYRVNSQIQMWHFRAWITRQPRAEINMTGGRTTLDVTWRSRVRDLCRTQAYAAEVQME